MSPVTNPPPAHANPFVDTHVWMTTWSPTGAGPVGTGRWCGLRAGLECQLQDVTLMVWVWDVSAGLSLCWVAVWVETISNFQFPVEQGTSGVPEAVQYLSVPLGMVPRRLPGMSCLLAVGRTRLRTTASDFFRRGDA